MTENKIPGTDAQTIGVYDARASEYDSLVHKSEPDKTLLEFVAELPKKASVLDLGCGPGSASAYMGSLGHLVTALDASQSMVDLAAQHPGVVAQLGTFEDIPPGPFDGVWANFSLLHAERSDLPRYLRAISLALKPGGVFHIGMKLGDTTARDGIGRRYTYVTQAELTGLLQDAGMAITKARTGSDVGLDGVVAPWVCLRAITAPDAKPA